jgi:SulP family sulfate permease
VPQAIGFALILGLPPMPVIVSVVVGGFFSSLFFSSHYHVFGPTTSVCLIIAATITANTNLGLHPLALAAYLAFLIGLAQFLAGLLNFGEVTKFISRSVVIGYSTAIGVLLITSQFPNLMGFHVPAGEGFVAVLTKVAGAALDGAFSWWAIGIGLLTLAIFEAIRRWRQSWPEALIGLAVLGLAAKFFAFLVARDHIFGLTAVPFKMVQDEGALMAVIPRLERLPSIGTQLAVLTQLSSTVIAIAIIGMLEATAITKSLAARSGQAVEPNQELLGMGVGNIACGLFGVPPGSSSFTRSAVNYQSGATSQLSSILSSVVVLLILFLVTPVFNYIPIAALAAHLMRVGLRLINRTQIRVALRSTRSDAVVFAVTLVAALFFRLETAIYVGIGVALVLFLQKTSTPSLVEYAFNESGQLAELPDSTARANPQISIVHVEGELYFGAADLFQEEVRRLGEDVRIRVFILRMKNARHLDASTVMAMENLHDYLRRNDRHMLISGCNADVMKVLKASGALAQIGPENVFPAEANLTMSTKRALKRATELLHTRKADVRLFYNKKREKASDVPVPPGNNPSPDDYVI